MNNNSYPNDILAMSSNGNAKSEIVEFYKGLNIFITGGSGFIGHILIEKLFRSCPKIGNIYFLLRKKKDKSALERLKEMFKDELFSKMKSVNPNFMEHIVIIEGDTSLPDLGLSPGDKNTLIENTHIVFHGAATTRFDGSLRTAIEINVKGTKKMLMLAKEMKNLMVFMHLSTAFSHCPNLHIEEKFYKSPMDIDKLISLVEYAEDDMLERLTKPLINEWPNTYSFSKACAEEVVRQYGKDMPICLARPSIVTSTYKEPLEGWNNSFYGPTGLVMAGYLCVLHTEFCRKHLYAEIIPADYVVNNMIAAAWDLGKSWKNKKCNGFTVKDKNNLDSKKNEEEPTVYNIVTTSQNPVSWNDLFNLHYQWGSKNLCDLHVWYYFLIPTDNKFLYNILFLLTHTIPGAIMDKLLIFNGKKPLFSDLYKKIRKFGEAYSYFKLQQWNFDNNNVMNLWEKMNSSDRELFLFNAKTIDWNDFARCHIEGIRKYILKRPQVPNSIKFWIKYYTIAVVHYTIVTTFFYSLAWISYKILMIIYLFISYQITSPECIATVY